MNATQTKQIETIVLFSCATKVDMGKSIKLVNQPVKGDMFVIRSIAGTK